MSYYPKQYNSGNWDIPGHYFHIGLGVLLLSFVLYILTLAPTVIWGDSADFALQVKNLKLKYGVGGHPLFMVIGKLFSILPFDLAYSLNLLTAVSASAAVFLVYLVIFEITNSKISSLAGSLALCVSHAFWLHAVITEVYDLNAAFLAAVILFLFKWKKDRNNYSLLYIAALLYGLGFSNHRVIAFEAVGVIFFIAAAELRIFLKLRVILYAFLSFFAGISLLVFIVIREMLKDPVIYVADKFAGEGYKGAFIGYSPQILKEIGFYLSYLFYQFPFTGFLLGFTGFAVLFKRDKKLAVFFTLLIAVNALFFLKFGPSYGHTKYTFYISAYMVFSILIGYGFFSFQGFIRDRGHSVKKGSLLVIASVFLLPVIVYNITPYASKRLGINLLNARTIPYRDNGKYFLNPAKNGYYGPARYAREALTTAKEDSMIIADLTLLAPLRYFQEVKGVRKDVTLVSINRFIQINGQKIWLKDFLAQHYGNKDIYLADIKKRKFYAGLNRLKNDYNFIPEGVLYRVVRKEISKPPE